MAESSEYITPRERFLQHNLSSLENTPSTHVPTKRIKTLHNLGSEHDNPAELGTGLLKQISTPHNLNDFLWQDNVQDISDIFDDFNLSPNRSIQKSVTQNRAFGCRNSAEKPKGIFNVVDSN